MSDIFDSEWWEGVESVDFQRGNNTMTLNFKSGNRLEAKNPSTSKFNEFIRESEENLGRTRVRFIEGGKRWE